MDFESVKAWLDTYTGKQIRHRWLMACVGFVLLPFGTAVSGLMIFLILMGMTRTRGERFDDVMTARCVWITVGIVLVSFIVTLFITRKKEPEQYWHEDSTDDDGSFVGHYRARTMARWTFIFWIIMTGPRLLGWSIDSLREVARLKRQDTHSCAALLWVLMTSRTRVTYESIPQQLDWLDLQATLPQISELPGIVFLKTPPLGLSITDDLRTAIRTGGLP